MTHETPREWSRRIILENLRRWMQWDPTATDAFWRSELEAYGYTGAEADELIDEARGRLALPLKFKPIKPSRPEL